MPAGPNRRPLWTMLFRTAAFTSYFGTKTTGRRCVRLAIIIRQERDNNMKPEKGKWYYIEYGWSTVEGHCVGVIEDRAIMRFRWGGPFRERHIVDHDRIVAECADPRWLRMNKRIAVPNMPPCAEPRPETGVVAALEMQIHALETEMSELRKWRNSLDWNKHRMERLECLTKDADRNLQCFHDWRYMHIHDNMVIFHCERCGGIQRRKWQDLTEQEIQGLELLGIYKPGRSDK